MAVSQNIIRFLARYSEGLRLATQHGSTSAAVVEYAYRNQPQGSGAVGRWIDRTFLNMRAWENLRQRIETTRETVTELVARRRAVDASTFILDVASGTACYLRDLAHEHGGEDLRIACHDRDPRQVTHGRELAAAEGLGRFTFAVGDATDDSSYLASQDPDIILAIDLFPYLDRDEAVRTVMRLALAHLNVGGCFVCTTLGRPDVPPPNWNGNGLSLRPIARPPDTIGTWLRSAGFVNIEQRVCSPQGFTLIAWKPEQRGSEHRSDNNSPVDSPLQPTQRS